ncbi:efflux RND transporter periplasmic adaptor subunit [Caballeronia mineralivorans]|jgi:RND family efflux transporter MFP subunit|uniref:efflux RND transporter periplasmic adaptor subunit n=1 Tax=Caballeronia mineralivorans TaxID=2010198 RepID=UPI0023F10B54|nr:efflux RND transporter periplasmic adaptor subunit [Caballeronia mineralivorans]MDB5784597.1 hlyD secretion family protein [Caballeronia mineralivorans]
MKLARLFAILVVIGATADVDIRVSAEDVVTMPATQKRIVATVSAPARVQAAANAVLTAPAAGIVSGLRVLPGEEVHPGQSVARLSGPTVSGERARLAGEVTAAQVRVSTATQSAAIERQKFDEQLSTRDALARTNGELEMARQQLVAAQTAARSYSGLVTIVSPEAGTVTAVTAADGQYVSAGQPLVTVAASRGLYVMTNLYGGDAALVTVGQRGTFVSEGAVAPVAVVVQRVTPSVSSTGQMDVWLSSSPGSRVVAGSVGSVSLTVSEDKRLAVPTSALVLDGGRWWVLLHDKAGNQRRSVIPGLANGGWTSIEKGLSPGERVVTQDAYLLFHQDFATHYQQAD